MPLQSRVSFIPLRGEETSAYFRPKGLQQNLAAGQLLSSAADDKT